VTRFDPTDDERPAAIAAVQRAALERGVLGEGETRRHLALASALEPARRSVSGAGDAVRDVMASVLVTTVAASALGTADGAADSLAETDRPVSSTGPWYPGGPGREASPVVDGAALAHRRLDVPIDRIAVLADVSPAAVRRAVDANADRESVNRRA
jgi:hypothetical protein